MYQDFFGLNTKPFGIVPDTRFLFLSESHREAIAHLVYALNEKNGFVQLTGEVGVGKTMVCRHILANIPKDIDVALILNPRVDEIGLLRNLCQEFGIKIKRDYQSNELTQLINKFLLATHASGRHTILMIDEAQNLPQQTLEQLRLLTNLETDTQKLLRIILVGQPELGDLLARYDTRQVAQRITSRYHLGSLKLKETETYIQHRLNIAGTKQTIFSKAAARKVHRLTEGTPRLINLLCDRALIGAYSMSTHEVTPKIVKIAAKEALPILKTDSNKTWLYWLPMVGIFVLLLALASLYKSDWQFWGALQWRNASLEQSKSQAPATQPSKPSDQGQQATKLTTPKSDQIESIKKSADLDYRLGIPNSPQN